MPYCQPHDLAERTLDVQQTPPGRTGQEVATDRGPLVVLAGSGIVFSAPHEVAQVRDGEEKIAEGGTAELAAWLAGAISGSYLATSGVQLGDPNHDGDHPYSAYAATLTGPVGHGGALVDLHQMRSRGPEVCLGLGPDHHQSEWLWKLVLDELLGADLRVSINWPFGARGTTVTAQLQRRGIPAVQVEIAYDCFDSSHAAYVPVRSALLRVAHRLAERVV